MGKFKPIIIVAVVILLFAGGAYVYKTSGVSPNLPKPEVSQSKQTKESGGAPAETSQTEEQPKEKILAPDFTLKDMEENEVTLSDYRGKTVVVNFWATWCSICKDELPELSRVYEENIKDSDDVVFFAIDLTDGHRETKEKVEKFMEDNGYSFPVLLDEKQEAAYAYGVTGVPATVVIDSEGYVVSGYLGPVTEEIILRDIEEAKK